MTKAKAEKNSRVLAEKTSAQLRTGLESQQTKISSLEREVANERARAKVLEAGLSTTEEGVRIATTRDADDVSSQERAIALQREAQELREKVVSLTSTLEIARSDITALQRARAVDKLAHKALEERTSERTVLWRQVDALQRKLAKSNAELEVKDREIVGLKEELCILKVTCVLEPSPFQMNQTIL